VWWRPVVPKRESVCECEFRPVSRSRSQVEDSKVGFFSTCEYIRRLIVLSIWPSSGWLAGWLGLPVTMDPG
jgi:hypothetical protein